MKKNLNFKDLKKAIDILKKDPIMESWVKQFKDDSQLSEWIKNQIKMKELANKINQDLKRNWEHRNAIK